MFLRTSVVRRLPACRAGTRTATSARTTSTWSSPSSASKAHVTPRRRLRHRRHHRRHHHLAVRRVSSTQTRFAGSTASRTASRTSVARYDAASCSDRTAPRRKSLCDTSGTCTWPGRSVGWSSCASCVCKADHRNSSSSSCCCITCHNV